MRQATPAAKGPAFVGRQADLEKLREAVREGSIVTLVGPGGVGKTRLARRFIEEAQDLGLAPLPLCDLSAAKTVEEVAGAVARTLGIRAGAESSVARIGQAIAALGKSLIVLDNCEQAIDSVAKVTTEWAAQAPEVVMMLTSREPTRTSAERVHIVLPLSVPEPGSDPTSSEAVALFVDRVARARNAAYVPIGEEAIAVAEIVRKLDGLPLAIELAAARAAVLGVEAILDRLSRRFELLAGGSSSLPERHRTIRATIQWSWELLDDVERSALAQCAIFVDGFTFAAAEAVLDLGGASCLDVVQRLVERSMLRSYEPRELPGEVRIGMYESIRELCAERLAELGSRAEVAARHATYYANEGARWADETSGPRGAYRMHQLTVELGNIRAAHEHLLKVEGHEVDCARAILAMSPTLAAHGPLTEHLRLLDATVTKCAKIDTPEARAILVVRGEMRTMTGRLDEARDDLTSVVKSSKHDPRNAARAHGALGLMHWQAGDLAAAEKSMLEAIDRAVSAGDATTEVIVLRRLANVMLDHRKLDDVRKYIDRALDRLRGAGVQGEEGTVLATKGLALHMLGRHDEAEEATRRGLRLLREMGDTHREGITLCNIGIILQQAHRPDDARIAYEQALGVAAVSGNWRLLGHVHFWLGRLEHEEGRTANASERYGDAGRFLEGSSAKRSVRLLHAARAAVIAELGDVAGARRDLAEEVPKNDAALADAIEVYAAYVDVCESKNAVAKATALRDRLTPSSEMHEDVAFALRVLGRKLEPEPKGQRAPSTGKDGVLHIGGEGGSFRAPGGTEVDLSRKRSLRLVLLALAKHRLAAPGKPLSIEELVRRAWPGERMLSKSAAMRAYTSITRLRKLGLSEVLISRGNGYLFEPHIELVLGDA